ncbi:MAG: hypothetical protein K2X27_00205 [Candidatus Obscuribacterales bacterium]|nr:hypothetical protein [Candidatus Obscuribacterales bacterium]
MSLESFKKIINEGKLTCPKCKKAIKQFDKYVERMASVWDGAGDSHTETEGSLVTLICANDGCSFKERTEYWDNYLSDD